MQSYAAKWILKTRENRSLTKSAMQGIITDTADIISFTTSTLESQVRYELSALGVSSQTISSLDKFLKDQYLTLLMV